MAKKKSKNVSSDPYDMAYGDSYDSYGDDPYATSYTDTSDPYDDDPYGEGGGTTSSKKGKKKNNKKTGNRGKKGGNIGGTLVAIVVVIALLVGILSGVGALVGPTKGQCKDTIEQAEYSLNTMDVNGLCDVINPMIGRKLKALIMVANMLTPEDAASYIESAIDQLGGSILPEGMDAADVLEEIEIEPYRFGLPGKTRKVKCNLIFAGSTYAKVEIHLKKAEGEVYISKIKSVNE